MKKNLLAIIFLLITGTVISYFLFEPVLKDPNSYLYSKGGDAVKSYFNFSYYLKYDEGIRHDGINYPYGDHLQYINSHPLYVNILKFVDNNIVKISNYGPGILNLTMIFSLVLALPFIFLILRKYSLPVWYSLVISLIILYLTPQFDRIHGHFEMVYAFFIPLFWYLLIRFNEGKKLLWAGMLLFSALIGGFTSAYFVAFFSIFLLAYLIVKVWINRKDVVGYRKDGIQLLVVAIVPLIIVRGLVSITDWVDDRPDNPWGFFIFHSNIWSIFLPNMSSLKAILNDPHFLRYQWEGKAYVGLPATVLAILMFVSFIYFLFSKKKSRIMALFPNPELNAFLASAFIVLLFSMCFPFKYGFGFLKDLIPPLKQFRALGRFSWIFYYVFTVYTAHLIYIYYRRLKLNGYMVLAVALLALSTGYWAIDAGMNIKISTRNLFHSNDLLQSSSSDYNKVLDKAGINTENYQAVMFLPYANTCGDKLLFTRGMEAFNQAMSLSYHTRLPLIQSFSPRLSFKHALSSIQMLADPPLRKVRLDDMNEDPILVLKTNEKLSNQEEWIVNNSIELFRNETFTLFELDPDVYSESYSTWKKGVNETIDELNFTIDNLYSDVKINTLIHKDFEEEKPNRETFSGNGAYYIKKGKEYLLTRDDFTGLPAGTYKLSFWVYVDTRTDNMPEAKLFSWNKDGKPLSTNKLNNREEHNIYNHWLRVDHDLKIDPENDYALEIKGKYISIDELLVQPENSSVYLKKAEGYSLFNNYPVE